MNGKQGDLFDLAEGRRLQAEGIERVSLNAGNFIQRGLAAIAVLPPGRYTGETIRAKLLAKEIAPHHPNAWGALILAAIKRGMLHHTGHYVPMRSKKSHAHKNEVYER